MPWSSNATFLVDGRRPTTRGQGDLQAGAGRAAPVGLPARPLPSRGRGLAAVRVPRVAPGAADHHPRRSVRPGLAAAFVAADFEQHYFTLYEGRADLHDVLRPICAFDLLANNTDRKSGHCLLGLDGRI